MNKQNEFLMLHCFMILPQILIYHVKKSTGYKEQEKQPFEHQMLYYEYYE